jgi:hypothetical protein
MPQKKFLVTVEYDDTTRFTMGGAETETLRLHIAGVYKVWTHGPEPAVDVAAVNDDCVVVSQAHIDNVIKQLEIDLVKVAEQYRGQ